MGWVARYTSPDTMANVQLVTRDATAPEDSVVLSKRHQHREPSGLTSEGTLDHRSADGNEATGRRSATRCRGDLGLRSRVAQGTCRGGGFEQKPCPVAVGPVILGDEVAGREHDSVRGVEQRPGVSRSSLIGVDARQGVQRQNLGLDVVGVSGGGEHRGQTVSGVRRAVIGVERREQVRGQENAVATPGNAVPPLRRLHDGPCRPPVAGDALDAPQTDPGDGSRS